MHNTKKYYGQHFLHDANIARKIAELPVGYGTAYRDLLEIGPGEGVLTQHISPKDNLHLIEIDRDLKDTLQIKFPELTERIRFGDFLKLPLDEIFSGQFGIIGNFPYNISNLIMFRVLEYHDQIPEVVGMFQKEVAERLTAPHGSKVYGKLSVLIQTFYDVKIAMRMGPQIFSPPPKVDSAVIHLQRKENFQLPCDKKLYIRVVKTIFGQRRKAIRNTLKTIHKDLPEAIGTEFTGLRPEQVSVAGFIEIGTRADAAKLF